MNLEQELLEHVTLTYLPGESPGILNADDDLIGSGILDSLAMVNLVTYLEQKYAIGITSGEITYDNFSSVIALAKLVSGKNNPL